MTLLQICNILLVGVSYLSLLNRERRWQKIKETFYNTTIRNAVDSITVKELLRLIKNYTDEQYIEDVLIELRELKDDTYQQSEIQEVINILSKERKLCPICSNKMVYKTEKEIHSELDKDDPHRIEEIVFLHCEECGFNDKD